VNDNPTAVADTFTVAEDTPVSLNLLGNDSIAPDTGETLTVTAITQPLYGTSTLVNGVVGYTPNANYFGPDTFTYTISDGNGGTSTATISITVTPVNDPPTAVDDSATVAKDTTNNRVNVLANDSIAPDTSETLSVTAVGTASHGTVTIAAGGSAVLYTPTAGYEGPDSFSYTISDNQGATATATVTIFVGRHNIFLPAIFGKPTQPDLVVTDFSITPAGPSLTTSTQVVVSVTVKNNGQLPTGAFWVDFYISPSVVPSAANRRWDTVCGTDPCRGIAWFVTNGLGEGQSITLTSVASSYDQEFTRWQGLLPVGTKDLYVYVDSWNGSVAYGAVEESNEANNRAEIRGLTVNATIQTNTTQPEAQPVLDRPLPSNYVNLRQAGRQ
jgi:hypothetical protein